MGPRMNSGCIFNSILPLFRRYLCFRCTKISQLARVRPQRFPIETATGSGTKMGIGIGIGSGYLDGWQLWNGDRNNNNNNS